ncbi:DUF447 domain-containing protein [Thermococcus sp.]
MLKYFTPGKVYEVLLTTKSNVTPVGVVREGETLRFKLFKGRSFDDLLSTPEASIQITNDVQLIVKSALNLDTDIDIVSNKRWRWIKGLPGLYGIVQREVTLWKDELGETEVLQGKFIPVGEIQGRLSLRPFSRADCLLVEMAVLFTRFKVSSEEETCKKIKALYELYKHLGGNSELAEYIMENLKYRSE